MGKYQLSSEEYERIKNAQNEAFKRIDRNKDQIMKLLEKQSVIIEQIKDNKIDDLMSNEELHNKIKGIASNSGRKTLMKWLPLFIGVIEVVRKVLESL